jgi:tetratricopeptide (TPR) repeat protein
MDRVAYFEEHLSRRPDDRFARYSLALELKKAGRTDEAVAAFAELLRRHPHSGAGHYQLGLLWQERGDDDRAREAWEAGLAALAGVTDTEARRSVREIEGALAALG